MRAVVLTRFGGPEVLGISDIPEPVPGPEDLLIRIQATALNRADLLEREGRYPPPGKAPRFQIPGLECAGIVEAVGDQVSEWAPGDRVMALLSGGGYAEYVTVHERMAMKIPETLQVDEAAGVPEAFLTAYDALFDKAGVKMGDAVLVHAGASGVGTAAIQLAAAAGAQVITTVGSEKKAAAVAQLGAHQVVNYRTRRFLDEVRQWTAGQGVQAVLDFVGQDYLQDNLASLRPGGTVVVIGTLSGGDGHINLGLLLSRRLNLRGTALRSRAPEEKMRLVEDFRRHAWPFLASGRIRPVIDRRFSISEVADAHRYMQENQNIGKILLTL